MGKVPQIPSLDEYKSIYSSHFKANFRSEQNSISTKVRDTILPDHHRGHPKTNFKKAIRNRGIDHTTQKRSSVRDRFLLEVPTNGNQVVYPRFRSRHLFECVTPRMYDIMRSSTGVILSPEF
ncbi:hypothetical protein JTE90_019817 [Oedothorax gibbosus]|uniref:Uncharacterized protein n=1 Tax=Oedothorax gibbosus TaxID=931172 RepID=A0AAV6V6T2_9ARAC|nr:hypothetical protein JTE90_019817 [Oedothorax gibbosus]